VSGSFFCRRRSDLAQVVDAISGEGDDAVDPKATVFRVYVAAEHIEIASMRIAPELLLDLQCQTVHAPPHVRVPDRQPQPNARRNRDHRRDNALTTAAVVHAIRPTR